MIVLGLIQANANPSLCLFDVFINLGEVQLYIPSSLIYGRSRPNPVRNFPVVFTINIASNL